MTTMQLANTMIYLIGHAGVGKYTIGKQLAEKTGAKLVDSHLVNNPVLSVLDLDAGPFPDLVWEEAVRIRKAVLHTIRMASPAHFSFIFTNVLYEDDTQDHKLYDQIVRLARARSAALFPVVLYCDAAELERRKTAPGRRERFKDTGTANLEQLVRRQILTISHPNLLTLDAGGITAEQSAEHILEHVRKRHAD